MSNKATDKLLAKARDYLGHWKDGELYRTRLLEVLEAARNPAFRAEHTPYLATQEPFDVIHLGR